MLRNPGAFVGWGRSWFLGLVVFALCGAAHAQVRYISVSGNDSSACTNAAAPCRTLQRGVNAAPAGGEVRILSSGIYNAASIGKSLTVSGDGATVIGRIAINNASAVVALRGLSLKGNSDQPVNGVTITAAAAVHIERCDISRFGGHGIYLAASNTELYVDDSIVRENGGAGLAVNGPDDTKIVVIDNSHMQNNLAEGILALGGRVTIIRSTISSNRANGINLNNATATIAWTTSSQNGGAGISVRSTTAMVESTRADSNESGVVSASGSTTTLSNSTFTNNRKKGIFNAGGTVRTRGNNTVAGNGTDAAGTLTPLAGI